MSHAGPPTRPDGPQARDSQRSGSAGSASSSSSTSPARGTGGGNGGGSGGVSGAPMPRGASSGSSEPSRGATSMSPPSAFRASTTDSLRDITDRQRAAAMRAAEGDDWGRIAAFAGGIALGALIGAGAALLMAPKSGFETRVELKRRARHMRLQAGDQWDTLGTELRRAARRKRNEVSRGVTRGRWKAADFFGR